MNLSKQMRTKVAAVVLFAALGATLTACGNDDRSEADRTDSTNPSVSASSQSGSTDGGPGVYAFETNGAKGTVEIPVVSTDPRFSEVENYRAKVGGEPVVYVVVEIDNTGGQEVVEVSDIEVVTEDAQQATVEKIWSLIGDWQEKIPAADESGVYNEGVELYNKHLHHGDVLPGAKDTVIYGTVNVGVEIPQRVFVTVGYDQVEAKKGA